jgi:peroxiredoxin Q/BCP
MLATINQKITNLTFTATDQSLTSFSQLEGKKGKWVVLYFYPRDNTSGCTQEARDFSDHISDFNDLNTVVLGVSKDTLLSHQKFIEKTRIPFPLISDKEGVLCGYFDVMKEKSLYGKKYIGIDRSTFIINPKGVLCQQMRQVKVRNHVLEVLSCLKQLQRSSESQ